MSETFFIKHTSFDDFSTDLTDRENASFIIGPGELNGPGGRDPRASDLELYGFGALKWGEGVNQNLFRILENFACPAKTTGSPPTVVIPMVPMDETDLGLGNGITVPLLGQTWYNTTDQELYMYGISGWSLVTASATSGGSAALTAHIADNDLHLSTFQNDLLDNLSPSLTSSDINQLVNFNEALGTVQQQLDLMVEKAGDTMTGDLILEASAQLQFEGGDHRITNNDGGGNFNIRVGHYFDATAGYPRYSDPSTGAVHLVAAHESASSPNFKILIGEDYGSVASGDQTNFTGTTTFSNDGNVSVSATAPTATNHLARKDYVDNTASTVTLGLTPIGGIIMYNGALNAIPANWQLCNGTNGTPNLTNRFVYGTVTESQIGDTGGSANATLVAHNHTKGTMNITGTVQNLPDDQHAVTQMTGAFSKSGGFGHQALGHDGRETYSINLNAKNSWTGSTSNAGSSATNANLPPYVKLAYIQRLS